MKRTRLVISMLLALCLVLTMIPATVFADANTPGETEDNPIPLTSGTTTYFNFGWNANGEKYGLGTNYPDDDNPYYEFVQFFSFKPSKTGFYDIKVSNPYIGAPDKYGTYSQNDTTFHGEHYIKPDGTWGSDYDVFNLYSYQNEKTGKIPSTKAYFKSGYTYIIRVESDGLDELFDETHDYHWNDGRENYTSTNAEYKTFDWEMGIKVSKDTQLNSIKAPTIKSLSKAKKGFTIKWKKPYSNSKNIDYEICYSTNKNFKKSQTFIYPVTLGVQLTTSNSAYKKASLQIKGLKSKKKYYVKMRTVRYHFGYISGTSKYAFNSKWTKTKTVTTK